MLREHFMHTLIAAHTAAGFEWVECIHNVVQPDPSLRGYIMKDGVYVPKWLSVMPTFVLETFILKCKCKAAACKSKVCTA